jgi:hypothetical protein
VRGRAGHGGDDASAQQRGVAGLKHGVAGDGCTVPPTTTWPSAASPLPQPSVRLAWPWREARGKLVPGGWCLTIVGKSSIRSHEPKVWLSLIGKTKINNVFTRE